LGIVYRDSATLAGDPFIVEGDVCHYILL